MSPLKQAENNAGSAEAVEAASGDVIQPEAAEVQPMAVDEVIQPKAEDGAILPKEDLPKEDVGQHVVSSMPSPAHGEDVVLEPREAGTATTELPSALPGTAQSSLPCVFWLQQVPDPYPPLSDHLGSDSNSICA